MVLKHVESGIDEPCQNLSELDLGPGSYKS